MLSILQLIFLQLVLQGDFRSNDIVDLIPVVFSRNKIIRRHVRDFELFLLFLQILLMPDMVI